MPVTTDSAPCATSTPTRLGARPGHSLRGPTPAALPQCKPQPPPPRTQHRRPNRDVPGSFQSYPPGSATPQLPESQPGRPAPYYAPARCRNRRTAADCSVQPSPGFTVAGLAQWAAIPLLDCAAWRRAPPPQSAPSRDPRAARTPPPPQRGQVRRRPATRIQACAINVPRPAAPGPHLDCTASGWRRATCAINLKRPRPAAPAAPASTAPSQAGGAPPAPSSDHAPAAPALTAPPQAGGAGAPPAPSSDHAPAAPAFVEEHPRQRQKSRAQSAAENGGPLSVMKFSASYPTTCARTFAGSYPEKP